jgi:threonine/homoserine/homoserine lactone efflux protein
MGWSNFALFFAASWVLIITPGPDMIYVITRGISQGRKAGMISAIGVTLGILVHTIFAACGLAIVLRTSANVLNPKIALFFLAFLPQFVNQGHGSAAIQMVYLGLMFALFGVVFLVLLGYFSGKIGLWFSNKQNFAEKIRWFTGSVLIALGLRLAFMERR